MNTLLLNATKQREKSLEVALELLRSGQPIAFPTETVYGIGGGIYDENAVEKVFLIKQRLRGKPLSAHIASIDHAEQVAIDIPELFYLIAKHFMPGPVSIILEKSKSIPSVVTGGYDTIAVRMPDNDLTLDLIRSFGQPLAGTSANLSGKPSPTEAKHVIDDLGGKLAAILDYGKCRYNIESTLISLVDERPTILRPGAISAEALEEKTGEKFYIPRTDLAVISDHRHIMRSMFSNALKIFDNLSQLKDYLRLSNYKEIVILSSSLLQFRRAQFDNIIINESNFFDTLRIADSDRYDCIIIYYDDELKSSSFLSHRIENIKRSL